jgi:hypothetical protein
LIRTVSNGQINTWSSQNTIQQYDFEQQIATEHEKKIEKHEVLSVKDENRPDKIDNRKYKSLEEQTPFIVSSNKGWKV